VNQVKKNSFFFLGDYVDRFIFIFNFQWIFWNGMCFVVDCF
jgi:hypothetical protein